MVEFSATCHLVDILHYWKSVRVVTEVQTNSYSQYLEPLCSYMRSLQLTTARKCIMPIHARRLTHFLVSSLTVGSHEWGVMPDPSNNFWVKTPRVLHQLKSIYSKTNISNSHENVMGLVVFMHGPCILLPRRSLLAFEFHSWTSHKDWTALYGGTDAFELPHPLECQVISPWASFFLLLLSEDLSIKHWCLFNVVGILTLLNHTKWMHVKCLMMKIFTTK